MNVSGARLRMLEMSAFDGAVLRGMRKGSYVLVNMGDGRVAIGRSSDISNPQAAAQIRQRQNLVTFGIAEVLSGQSLIELTGRMKSLDRIPRSVRIREEGLAETGKGVPDQVDIRGILIEPERPNDPSLLYQPGKKPLKNPLSFDKEIDPRRYFNFEENLAA